MCAEVAGPCRILVIFPNRIHGTSLVSQTEEAGFPARLCTCAADALRVLGREHVAVVLLPVGPRQGDSDGGLALLRDIARVSPHSQVVALLDPATDLEICCEAVSLGVAGVVEAKGPPPYTGLANRVAQAWERYQVCQREREAACTGRIFEETGFAGRSRAMAELLVQAKRIAAVSDVPVLIEGESGTGKQLLAEAIHRLDAKRSRRPFVSVNCAAITGTLAESALFGHTRGAFTGATEARLGYFRAADGGTLLLDEVSVLRPELQPKLLRALQEGVVLPVGSDEEVPVDVRVIAATNRSLEALVADGRFRLDLYQRLNVAFFRLPPLRERPEDIAPLFQHFLRKYRTYYPATVTDVDPRVYDVIARSLGRGNVRELENLVRQLLSLKRSGARIELSDLPRRSLVHGDGAANGDGAGRLMSDVAKTLLGHDELPLHEMTDRVERLVLSEMLRQGGQTHAQMARRLGFTRRTLYNKLRKHRLRSPAVPDRPARTTPP